MNRTKETSLQQQRNESRVAIDDSFINKFRLRLLESGYHPIEHSCTCVQTLYFTTEGIGIPPMGYLRARRYIPFNNSGTIDLNPENIWIFEAKHETKGKHRKALPLNEIMELVLNDDSSILKAVLPEAYELKSSLDANYGLTFATEWKREHYATHALDIRTTIDMNRVYYGFRWQSPLPEIMGSLERKIVEFKYPLGSTINLAQIFGDIPFDQLPEGWHGAEVRRMYREFTKKDD